MCFFYLKQKTAYEIKECDWSSDVCSSDLEGTDKPAKKDDHVPDATMCALRHWPIGKMASMLPKSNLDQEEQRSSEQGTITGGLIDERF